MPVLQKTVISGGSHDYSRPSMIDRDRRRFEAACSAMQAYIAKGVPVMPDPADRGKSAGQWWSEQSVACADALLAELERTTYPVEPQRCHHGRSVSGELVNGEIINKRCNDCGKPC